MLVLFGAAAAFRAAFLPHMTESSVASKLAEANHPVACPPQWLPVILAANTPVATTNGRRLTTVFATKAELKTALGEYNDNAMDAIDKYDGPPNTWDVSDITDMKELFKDLDNINADISSWDTSGVTTMEDMFRVRVPSTRPLAERLPCVRLAPPPRPPPCRLSLHLTPLRIYDLPCDSAGSVGVQPAADLRYVQRHNHGTDV